jgi:hypothetical protein
MRTTTTYLSHNKPSSIACTWYGPYWISGDHLVNSEFLGRLFIDEESYRILVSDRLRRVQREVNASRGKLAMFMMWAPDFRIALRVFFIVDHFLYFIWIRRTANLYVNPYLRGCAYFPFRILFVYFAAVVYVIAALFECLRCLFCFNTHAKVKAFYENLMNQYPQYDDDEIAKYILQELEGIRGDLLRAYPHLSIVVWTGTVVGTIRPCHNIGNEYNQHEDKFLLLVTHSDDMIRGLQHTTLFGDPDMGAGPRFYVHGAYIGGGEDGDGDGGYAGGVGDGGGDGDGGG